ncbi:ATP-binding protein [Reinekea sp. G2M2-21]|uniref:ATP-binding protein n=1 Tax=Reinekea sp. G2M2-21 TaxID=2788942 RepID=UPI0018AB0078|nr:ATP-binding protein [Reinekea sp. G2M2-21]
MLLLLPIAFGADNTTLELAPRLTLIADPEQQLTPEQALSSLSSTPMNAKPQLTLSHNTGTYWLSFWLKSGASENVQILDLDYIFIEHSELYRVGETGLQLLDRVDINDSVFKRNVVYRKPAFMIYSEVNSETRYLFKLTLISKPNAALELRPVIWPLSTFLQTQLSQNIAFFLLIGLFTALALYNAILYLRIGVKGHIYYSLYLLSMVLIIASYEGLLFYLPVPPPASWVIASISIAPTLSSVFLMAFGLNVLQLERFRPTIARFYKRAIVIVLLGLPITLLKLSSFNFWLEISVVLLTIGLGVIAAAMIKQGQKTAIYFATSFIFIATGYGIETTLYSLPMLDILGSELALKVIPWMEQYFFYTCSVIEVFFLAMALASYIDALRLESNEAKRKVLEQLETTAQMKADYAQTLEREVIERTSQLEVQRKVLARQNEKLLEMDSMKSQFLANISHEFRTPLTLIKGPLQRILSGELKDNTVQLTKAIETSSRNANRLSRLMEELLTLSHLEANQLRLQVQAIEVNSFCRRITSLFEHQAIERDVVFSQQYLKADTVLFFDPNKVETVLCNLLSNAFKYTPRQGNVHFGLSLEATGDAEQGVCRFAVSDTGPGIPQTMHSRIFERFYRLEQDDRSGVEGSGIGLSLVRELTDLHGGQVEVQSGETGGSVFTVTLPLGFSHFDKGEFATHSDEHYRADTPTTALDAQLESHPTGEAKSRPTLLLVEDVADMRDYIASHFQSDYHLITASDGLQAWNLIQSQPVDIVVTDLMMPLMDGMQLLASIRSQTECANIPVMMLTARSSHADRNLALSNLADDYLAKPFDSEELVLRVRNLWQRHSSVKAEADIAGSTAPPSADEQWLAKATQYVQENLANPAFDALTLADKLAVSKPTLHRHMEKAAQTTPAAFIRDLRLQKARELMDANAFRTVAEVAYAVGFASPGYFSRLYKQRFPAQAADSGQTSQTSQ